MSPPVWRLPPIPPEERTPTVDLLLSITESQHHTITTLTEQVQQLQAELARLQKRPARPEIKPSALERDKDDDPPPAGGAAPAKKRPGSNKRSKRPPVHRTVIVTPPALPAGSRLLSYQDYLVQDLVIEACNTRYRLARYQTPGGQTLSARVPAALQGTHFGPTLRSFILYQYHHQRVTQPLLWQQLREWGIDLSSGQLHRLITEDQTPFHQEKDALLSAALGASTYLHVDDTGARHAGKNGYCTHLGNEHFAVFHSTDSKSRINFLQLLRGSHTDYVINTSALDYLRAQHLPQMFLAALQQGPQRFDDDAAWNAHLQALGIHRQHSVRTATEGALIGSLVHHGFPPQLVILSDDAGQFNVWQHALCWIHAERVFRRILPLNEHNAQALEAVRAELWTLYASLKDYRQAPAAEAKEAKEAITAHFNTLCKTKTTFQTLNQALKRLARNQQELLLVLERPDIPLHNNLSERDIREYVIKRKISGSTRSEEGRRCRDTFASLKKTCQKQKVSFWDYLTDRLTLTHAIPALPDLVCGKAFLPP